MKRQHNVQMKKDKGTNNDLQITRQSNTNSAKTRVSGRESGTTGTVHVTLDKPGDKS